MSKLETIEDFYRTKIKGMPDGLQQELGQFNVFKLDMVRPVPYSRKDFFKICLMVGRNKFHYADKTIEIEKNGLLFANPQVPYECEVIDIDQTGYFCIFTEQFFARHSDIKDYPVFKPGTTPIFHISDKQIAELSHIFEKMFAEIGSDYMYKYDLLRNYVMELVHSAMKMQPATTLHSKSNASVRISSMFMELLERQFPIESPTQQVNFRSPTEFANQLSVHVNHLNRALKQTTNKTTSEVIADRITQEAGALLKHTNWNIAEIAYSLGFEEAAHFNNFFKKKTSQTPTGYRVAV